PGPPGTTGETHVDKRGRRSQRSRTRRWRGSTSVPTTLPRAREASAPIRWSSRAVLSSAVVHDRAHDSVASRRPSLRPGANPLNRADAGDSAGGDVLDAPEHAPRRLRASVEMEYETLAGELAGGPQDLGPDPPAIRLYCASVTLGRRYGPLPSRSMERAS